MDNRGKRQAASIFGGMGFYIALLVCVLAAGVVGYFALLRNDGTSNEPVQTVDNTVPRNSVPVSLPDEEPAEPVINDQPVSIPAPVHTIPEPEEDEETPVSAPAEVPEDAPGIAAEPVEIAPPVRVAPLAGETVAVFSVDRLSYDETLGDWRTHDGIDIQAEAGTAVTAACAGTVTRVEEDGRMGATVTIDHGDGYVTTYASLQSDPSVLAGDEVAAGAVIGTVGNTSLTEAGLGAHLHFSVTRNGEAIDPVGYLDYSE